MRQNRRNEGLLRLDSRNLSPVDQREAWIGRGTNDPQAFDVLYISTRAAPVTGSPMPGGDLNAHVKELKLGAIIRKTAATARSFGLVYQDW